MSVRWEYWNRRFADPKTMALREYLNQHFVDLKMSPPLAVFDVLQNRTGLFSEPIALFRVPDQNFSDAESAKSVYSV